MSTGGRRAPAVWRRWQAPARWAPGEHTCLPPPTAAQEQQQGREGGGPGPEQARSWPLRVTTQRCGLRRSQTVKRDARSPTDGLQEPQMACSQLGVAGRTHLDCCEHPSSCCGLTAVSQPMHRPGKSRVLRYAAKTDVSMGAQGTPFAPSVRSTCGPQSEHVINAGDGGSRAPTCLAEAAAGSSGLSARPAAR